MILPLVSETAVDEAASTEPKHPRRWAITPPVDLENAVEFTKGQPFEAFAQMRENAPVMWFPQQYGAGFWALTRYSDVRAVDLDTQRFSSQAGGILMSYAPPERRHPLLHRASLDAMINLDKPWHMPLRREHMPFFTPVYIAELRKKVENKVSDLLDRLERKGPVVDLVEDFSAELPLFTLCEMLGVPEADRPKFIEWMHFLETAGYTLQREELGEVDPQDLNRFLSEVQAMFEYGQAILKERRADPKDDLLSAIANAKVDGELLSDEYLDGSWLLIVFAGNDTTRNSISGTMRLLTEFPGEREKLIDDPGLIPNMVHEAIRMVSPVMYMRRTCLEDTEIGGQMIGEGEKVLMYYGAANRDPAVFADPDSFDVTRANAKDHLAFGIGPHVCLGQRVANMQLEAAYRQILQRFPQARWTGRQEIAPNNFVHAISKLEVDLRG